MTMKFLDDVDRARITEGIAENLSKVVDDLEVLIRDAQSRAIVLGADEEIKDYWRERSSMLKTLGIRANNLFQETKDLLE